MAWSDISNIIKAAAIYQIEDLAVVGDGASVKLVVRDKKNDTSNSYAVKVGITDKEFSFNFKVENLKLLPGDYAVSYTHLRAPRDLSTSRMPSSA